MKGDFSRAIFDHREYSRVLAQQGRVQLDADWNAQQAIVDYRLRTAVGDVFGHSELVGSAVVPAASPGFAVHVHAGGTFHANEDVRHFDAALDPSAAFSIEAWVRPDSVTSTQARAIASSSAFRVTLDDLGCVVFAYGAASGEIQTLSSTRTVRAGYTFAACTFTGDALEIWMDGRLDRRVAARAGAACEAIRVSVGGPLSQDDSSGVFSGVIERVELLRGRRFKADLRNAFLRIHDTESEHRVGHWHAREHGARVQEDLCLGPGRSYVDGLLCENGSHQTLSPSFEAAGSANGKFLVFLDVWERYVSAFEDPELRDPALGGLDTTGRLRVIAHPYVVSMEAGPGAMLDYLSALDHDRGQIAVDLANTILQDNLLYRFEVHAGGPAANTGAGGVLDAELLDSSESSAAGTRRKMRVEHASAALWMCGQYLQLAGADGAPADGILKVLTRPEREGSGWSMYVDDVPAGLTGSVRVLPIAAMLWSKENGHAVFSIDRIVSTSGDSTTLELYDEGRRSSLLHPGDTVVITWDERIETFQPGIVCSIESLATDVPGSISLVVSAPVGDLGERPTLRRWDGVLPAIAREDGKFDVTGDLTLRFSDSGQFRPGDYWIAQLRPDAEPALEWRRDPHRATVFAPPAGIPHVYAPLAFVEIHGERKHVVRDFRHTAPSVGDFDRHLREVMHEFEWPAAPQPEHHHHHETVHEREMVIERVVEAPPDDSFVLARGPLPGYARADGVVEARMEQLSWRAQGDAPAAGAAHAAAIGSSLYVLYADGTLWRRDPEQSSDGWTQCAPCPASVDGASVCVANQSLYVLGGNDRRMRPRKHVYSYDPRTDRWTMMPPMLHARTHACAVADTRGIRVFGGIRRTLFGWRYASRSVEVYDIERGVWRMSEPMPWRRHSAAAVRHGASILLVGGAVSGELLRRPKPSARIDRHVPATGAWTYFAAMSDTRVDARAVTIGGELFVLGDGSNGERVDLSSGEVTSFFAAARDGFGLAALDGTMYVISGLGYDDGMPMADLETCTVVERYRLYHREGAP